MEIQIVKVITEIRHRRNGFHFEVINFTVGIYIKEKVRIGIETSHVPFYHETVVFLPEDFAH